MDARFCPGCGLQPLDRVYRCRHGAVGTYCFECGTNWYIRDVGTRSEERELQEVFLNEQLLPLPPGRAVRTRG